MVRRVLIADDVPDIRFLLATLLDKEPDFQVVGEAEDGAGALKQTKKLHPDVILLDINMPGRDGLDVLPDLRDSAPDAKIIVFSGFEAETLARRTLDLGADDYLEKGSAVYEIVERIRQL